MASLSDKEINATLAKIRREYEQGAEKYGNKIYNLSSFNDRYREALQNRQDLSNFLIVEIKILEDIKTTLRDRELERQRKKAEEEKAKENSFMNKVDNMIEKFRSATEKYPLEDIHSKADDEIRHLYGAFKELYNCFSVIRFFCCGPASDYVVETAIKDYDNQFQKFIIPVGETKVPQIFADYVYALNNGDNSSRAEQFILKESGFFLHAFIEKMNNIKSLALKASNDGEIVLPDYLNVQSPRVYKFFKGKTKEEMYDATIAYANAMINDFRLQSFKKDAH
ncbi:hypothetical protein R4K54_02500 [Brachyspira murdochii]|uniref:Uncharacterized protein n=1 Tax=Brachyspira murdochii (strain ATCC 51284 / DSM 12563 / 56-150) TaxID=526224 RepID=D5U719_BRAM5|nr:hypothetical protein [Brachyspira murdochii]ADG72743.1 conserved hypothetical protein [Brachyspira murdochii DSM 12563]